MTSISLLPGRIQSLCLEKAWVKGGREARILSREREVQGQQDNKTGWRLLGQNPESW